MTELEKMKQGMLYDANDPMLMRERVRCKDLCFTFNQLKPSESSRQEEILKELFGKTGKKLCVTAPFWCDYGFQIEVGENFCANHNCVILDCAKVTFGDNVFVAPNCVFATAGHPLDAEERRQGLEYAYPVTVGDDVWFGASVTVLPGVSIGSGTVIGAGSVVTRDIPPGVVAAGNPCRVLRRITDEDKKRYKGDQNEI